MELAGWIPNFRLMLLSFCDSLHHSAPTSTPELRPGLQTHRLPPALGFLAGRGLGLREKGCGAEFGIQGLHDMNKPPRELGSKVSHVSFH